MIALIHDGPFAARKRMHRREDEVALEFPSSVSSRARGLLSLRAINWSAAGGAPLPYDAEVDYIQGNPDGAYIRIPTRIPASGSFSVRLFWSGNRTYGPNFRAIFLSEQTTRGSLFYQRWYAGGRLSCWIGGVTLFEIFDAGGKEHDIVDQAYSAYNESTLYLFGTASDNNGGAPWNPGSAGDDKLYSLSFKDSDGNLVIDLIPVRVGTVGYMYDRVSGELFGNSGTGAFIIGPDI